MFGAGAVTVVGGLAGAAVSIWIGRRTQQDRRWLWYVVPLNVVAAIAVPAFLAAAYMGASFGFLNNYGDYSGSSTSYAPDGLVLNGTPISNIYPFDAQGKQVNVRLYDQNGNPIDLEQRDCKSFFANDNATSNAFPLPVMTDGQVDEQNCKDSDKAPFALPPAPATATPTPTSSTTPKITPTLTVQPTR